MAGLLHGDEALHYLMESVTEYSIYMLGPDGRVLTWNRGGQRLKGYGREEIYGRHFSLFFTPEEQAEGVPERFLAKAAAEQRAEAEGWRVRKDGSRFWALATLHSIRDEAGELIGFAKVTRDMTAHRDAARALAESERQFRLLVSGVTDYALYMLDLGGRVTSWNAGAESIKGYAAAEIIGQHFSRFYTDADREAGRPERALLTARETGRYEAEAWRMRKNGSLFWSSVIIDLIRDESGEPIGFAKITRDITDKRNAQLELQRAQEQLHQAQKLEALGQLTGGVAHDFNNLLMVVSGQAEMLRRLVGEDPRGIRALDAIVAASGRGQSLTRHLLTFAQRQRLHPTAVPLPERIAAMKDLLAASLPPTVRLEFDLPDTLWPVEVDAGEFELCVLNVAVNARDAMPEGGALSIRAANVEVAGSDFVALTVEDTGVGIPDDILPRVFDPFFTTKELANGAGLGLSQVYGFCEQSGGGVGIESELGKGTRLTLRLPRSGRGTTAPEQTTHPPVAGARILLVEDNPDVAEVAAGLLEQLGHHVRAVGTGQAALEALREGAPPDLVFSDIVMAGEIDGIGLARRLRRDAPGLPVLLATGYSQSAETLRDEFPVLRKPYTLAELSRAVGAALTEARKTALDPAETARAPG